MGWASICHTVESTPSDLTVFQLINTEPQLKLGRPQTSMTFRVISSSARQLGQLTVETEYLNQVDEADRTQCFVLRIAKDGPQGLAAMVTVHVLLVVGAMAG